MSRVKRYDRLLDRLLSELRAHYGEGLVSVAVFGSVGRGTPRPGSDVDLLIVAHDLPAGRLARVRELRPVEDRLTEAFREAQEGPIPVGLSAVLKTPAEIRHGSPLFLDMVEDARILHDAGGFFAGYLDGLRSRLRALGSRRIWRGDTWHWDLKPDLRPGEVFTWP